MARRFSEEFIGRIGLKRHAGNNRQQGGGRVLMRQAQ
jgi:hypothetical protein